MTAHVFTGEQPVIGDRIAPEHISAEYHPYFTYNAGLHRDKGINADTFMKYAGRFALICDQTYQGSNLELKVNAAHPNITIDCEELREALRTQPGQIIPTPVDRDDFTEIFATAKTADLVIKPTEPIPDMPSTFAKVSWNRSASKLLTFYAQGGEGQANEDFQLSLFNKMFYVPESAPKRGIDVAIGLAAVAELRRYSVGNTQYMSELQERFDFTRAHNSSRGSRSTTNPNSLFRNFFRKYR